ncbi:MAG TPA: 3-deoxy-7-phosphoheptulonate synthase [Planctomycetota bacterium]|nr:3-deoxy-7-phosphoheptulonate synthase [Planctomycetota bacterium]
MILVLRQDCTREEVAYAEKRLKELGLEPHTLFGVERTVIAAIGDERKTSVDQLSQIPGVDTVMPILAPYKLASKESHPTTSVFEIGGECDAGASTALDNCGAGGSSALVSCGARGSPALGATQPPLKPAPRRSNTIEFGGKKIPFIAGPCSVEGRTQIIEAAHAVQEAGASGLRAGAFKPRTSPYQFQGLAEEGLEYLAEARDATGLPIITEVLTPADVPLVAKYADVLQIGTRNMQNFLLLRACGAARTPVLLKRGMSATLEEYLLAAEYILAGGNPRVLLCERGIRTFENYVRNTFALAMVPALKEKSHLPVLADPSHGTGVRKFVPPMTKAAVACGADGILIEVHPDPEKALTDGAQTISVKDFAKLVKECRAVAEAVGRAV